VSRQNPKLETVSYAKTKHQNKKNRTNKKEPKTTAVEHQQQRRP
jgi:hypothetical protein